MKESQRIEYFPVPDAALREALLNALVHRDYSVPAPIQIHVYEERLVVINPAVLAEGWSLETLLAPHYSQPFNPDIANAFFRAGEIEAWGRGIERIFEACRRHEVPAPCLRYQANAFWFEFPFADNYIKAVGSHTMRAIHEVTPPVTPSVTQPVAVVIRLLGAMGELGSAEIRQQLKLRDRTHLRNRYLDPCLEGGWIERTVPDKPNSRFQRYRLTAKGRAMLEALTHENGLTK